MKFMTAFVAALSLTASTAGATTFTAIVDSIALRNPEVINARLQTRISAAEIRTSAALPDPELEGEYMWMPADVDNRWSVGISWGLEWPGVYGARKRAAQSRTDAFEQLAAATEAEQRVNIATTLVAWQTQRRKLGTLETMAAANAGIVEDAAKREKGGQLSAIERNKLMIEAARFAMRIEEERATLAALTSQLSDMAGGADMTAMLSQLEDEKCDLQLPSLDEVLENAGSLPAVRSRMASVEAARRDLKTAANEAAPGISVGYKHLFEDGMHFNGVTLGVSLPVFSARGKKALANANLIQAEFEEATARNQALNAAALLHRQASDLQRQVNMLAPAFDNTDNFRLLSELYEGGQLSYADYQSEMLYFYDALIDYLDLTSRYHTALIALQPYLR